MNGKDPNVRVPATALRVMFAHGSFTPTGTDSMTESGTSAVDALSDVLLAQCVQRFNAWLDDRLTSVSPAR